MAHRKPERDIYTVSVTRSEYDWLTKRAEKKGKGRSWVLRKAINRYRKRLLRKQGKKAEAVKAALKTGRVEIAG